MHSNLAMMTDSLILQMFAESKDEIALLLCGTPVSVYSGAQIIRTKKT